MAKSKEGIPNYFWSFPMAKVKKQLARIWKTTGRK